MGEDEKKNEDKIEKMVEKLEEFIKGFQSQAACSRHRWKAVAITGIWIGAGIGMACTSDGPTGVVTAITAYMATKLVIAFF